MDFSTIIQNDLLTLYWMLLWTLICSYGIFVLLLNDSLPKFLVNIYVYGKALNCGRHPFWRWFLLPKSYFLHFYIAAILFSLTSQFIVSIYFSEIYIQTSDYVKETIGQSNYDLLALWAPRFTSFRADKLHMVNSLIFALILITIQVIRRAYECLFISVYSDTKINLIHYAFGFMFYLGICCSTICPILLSDSNKRITWLDIFASILTIKHAIGFVVFVYASIIQHKCHVILANLRRDRSGRVISKQYYVPSGYMFQLVTCPHFFAEIIIYIVISIIVNNTEWFIIATLVTSNQIVSALIQHRWYKSVYKEYPTDRKAIIPFLI